MAKLLSTIIDGFVRSKDFVSGTLGSGWRIALKLGRWVLEIDDLVVRGRMTVFELLIQKIRAVKGALGITQASGKIREIREDDTNYYIQVEDEMSFVANDIVKCQTFSGEQKNYWVIVSNVVNNEIVIPKSEFVNSSLPEVGDEMIQFGNTTDETRQSAIYLHADEGGQPAIDVLFGINSKSFDGKTKIRVGGDIPGSDGYKGFYCENGMIKSVNTKGETMYMLRPDGSGVMAKGNISWDVDGNGSIFNRSIYWDTGGFHFGSGIKLTWDNLDDTVKENLKGEPGLPGTDANLLPWVEDWNNPDNTTEIGGEYVISPKMFSGTRGAGGKLTGVAFGRDVIEVDGVKKTGVFGVKDGNVTFSIDAETGDVTLEGVIKAIGGLLGGFNIGLSFIGKSSDTENPSSGMSLYEEFIKFKAGNRLAAIGSNVFPPSTGLKGVGRFQNKEYSPYSINYGIEIDVSGANENIALDIPNGDLVIGNGVVKGGRYNLKYASWLSNYQIGDDDEYIVCTNSEKINLQLPPNPKNGKTIWIKQTGSGDVGVIPNNGRKMYYRGSNYNWGLINAKSGGVTVLAMVTFIGYVNGAYCWVMNTMDVAGLDFGNN